MKRPPSSPPPIHIPSRIPKVYSENSQKDSEDSSTDLQNNPNIFGRTHQLEFLKSFLKSALNVSPLKSLPPSMVNDSSDRNKSTKSPKSNKSTKSPKSPKSPPNKILFVTGLPGTGKTLAVTHCVRYFTKNYCIINCTKFSKPILGTLQDLIFHLFNTNRTTTPRQACSMIQKKVSESETVIILDEVDALVFKSSSHSVNLLQFLCNLAENPSSKLIFIGICNTLDFATAEKYENCIFPSYSAKDLEGILTLHLQKFDREWSKFISPTSVKYLSKKAAEISGDARSSIDIALSLARAGRESGRLRTISDATAYFRQQSSFSLKSSSKAFNPQQQAISILSTHPLFTLVAIALYQYRFLSNRDNALTFDQIYSVYGFITLYRGIIPLGVSEFYLCIDQLVQLGLVSKLKRKSRSRKLLFLTPISEIHLLAALESKEKEHKISKTHTKVDSLGWSESESDEENEPVEDHHTVVQVEQESIKPWLSYLQLMYKATKRQRNHEQHFEERDGKIQENSDVFDGDLVLPNQNINMNLGSLGAESALEMFMQHQGQSLRGGFFSEFFKVGTESSISFLLKLSKATGFELMDQYGPWAQRALL